MRPSDSRQATHRRLLRILATLLARTAYDAANALTSDPVKPAFQAA